MLLRHGKSLRRAGAPSPLLSPVTSTCATRHRTRPSDCLCSLPSDPTWTAPGPSSTKMKYQVISNHTYSGYPIFFSKDHAILEFKHKAKRRSHGDDRDREFHSSRCLMLLENSHKLYSTDELLSYIKSTFSELEGSNHCWFNMNAAIPSFDEKNIFLILIGAFLPNSTSLCRRKEIILFERVKMLQKIYPYLPVFGFQSCESKSSVHTQALVTSTIAEEYANFPVLLSDSFPKLPNEPCCLLLGGSGSHVKFDPDVDIQMIAAEIDKHSKLLCPESSQSLDVNEAQRNVVKALEVLKGFHSCSSFKNVLLNFPGCVSADGSGDRLFISDTNHHRIIICDSHGKIIDCIGSVPGYMDGGFESAQMHRPAASVYHADEDCLYFVDCENHSIRRAYLARRIVDTLYPVCSNRDYGMWKWILKKLGMTTETDQDSTDFTPSSFAFPWHLMMTNEDDLLILTRSLETSWIMSVQTGKIKSLIKGFSNVMEAHMKVIMRKTSVIEELYKSTVLPFVNPDSSLKMYPYINFISAIAELRGYYIYCDTAGHRVLNLDPSTGKVTHMNFSDMEVLGLPYWIGNPVESVLHGESGRFYEADSLQNFNILPGNCNILVNVDLPSGFDLAAPLQEACIWREARGSATEITNVDDFEYREKVGVAQQWYDELDNLFYSKLDSESPFESQEAHSDPLSQDEKKIHINCVANTSPGTSEIIITAALYLKLQIPHDKEELRYKLLNLYKSPGACTCVELLLQSLNDLRGLIFMRPLHLRIKLDSADHPKDPVTSEIISTTTNLEVNVAL